MAAKGTLRLSMKEENRNEIGWRKTNQILLPVVKTLPVEGKYDIYPVFKIADSQIFEEFESLVLIIMNLKTVIFDG
jgi:hypothetical protein